MVPPLRIARMKSQAANIAPHERERIEDLSADIAKLQERVARLEAQMPQPRLDPPVVPDFEHSVRDALRHLDDVAKLADSELAQTLMDLGRKPISGYLLQSRLKAAIHVLHPTVTPLPSAPSPHYYEILRLTYQEGVHAHEIAQTLAISKRQYYRELRAAILAVAEQLIRLC